MVRIDKKIIFGKVKIVEIIRLENGLDFTILILFCFRILVSIGLDDSCMTLVLAK